MPGTALTAPGNHNRAFAQLQPRYLHYSESPQLWEGFVMCNVLKPERQKTVLHMLVEGSSIRSTERLTGVHRDTIGRLAVRFGHGAANFWTSGYAGLTLAHLELDEIWTFVLKKQGRLTPDERQERFDIGDVYLWTALDKHTKLVPSFLLGKRSGDSARRFIMDVAGRLVFPNPHASDAHGYQPGGYQPIASFQSDGFAAYPEAVDLAFGPYAKYGQIIKDYRNADQPGRYAPPEMVGTERKGVYGMNEFEERTICTSHVERHNLTIRTLLRRFTRLALGFSKKLENLAAAVAVLHGLLQFLLAHPGIPTTAGNVVSARPPAAMLAGVTDHVWKFDELFSAIM